MNWIQRLLLGDAAHFVWQCKTCSVLREQIEYERSINKELTETLTSLLKPAPIVMNEASNQPVRVQPRVSWTRRRAELERVDRERVKAEKSPYLAKPDQEVKKEPDNARKTIEQLELELGVVDSEAVDMVEGDATRTA